MGNNSTLYTTISVAHALFEAPKEMGLNINWQANPGNGMQEMILNYKDLSLKLAESLSPKELMSKAAKHAAEVNAFLSENGFGDVQLEEQGPGLYAASIIKLLGKFLAEGERNYRLNKINKPGFRLGIQNRLGFFDYYGQTVVEIPTDSGFSLMITAPTGVNDYKMVDDWVYILSGMNRKGGNGVILPMADIKNTKIDVSDMCGMTDRDSDWIIMQALMAANFALTPSYVKFEAAFAYGAKRCSVMPQDPKFGDYVADHPLYFAIVGFDEYLPLAVGLVDIADLSNIDLE